MARDWEEKDHRTKILNMFYDWSAEHDIMLKIQRCQRNWDYEKWNNLNPKTRDEMITELLWVAQNAPSKQHEGYYDLYYTADRDIIQEISRYTWGNTIRRSPPQNYRNAQANASLYIMWIAKEPDTTWNSHSDGTIKQNNHHERWLNAYCSIGISVGLTMRAAAKMGFDIGANKNHNDLNGDDFWEKRLGILDDVEAGKKRITYGLGVGFGQEGRPRWEMDETELMIGAANGSKITLTDQEEHPRKKMKMRKARIVDIRATDKAIDPYGVEHNIPEKAKVAINTFRPSGIQTKEIK